MSPSEHGGRRREGAPGLRSAPFPGARRARRQLGAAARPCRAGGRLCGCGCPNPRTRGFPRPRALAERCGRSRLPAEPDTHTLGRQGQELWPRDRYPPCSGLRRGQFNFVLCGCCCGSAPNALEAPSVAPVIGQVFWAGCWEVQGYDPVTLSAQG